MKIWIAGLSLAALAAGSAYAVESQRGHADRDGNGVLTRAEADARAIAMFARRDANKDGKIDASDRAARQAARFDAIDADKNGQISRAEFTAERPHRMKGGGAGMHGDHPKGEHRMGGHRRRGHPGMMGGMMGAGADADKDGAITQAEFTAAAARRFDRIDANKDGQATREERQALHGQMRQQWRERAEQRGAAPAPPAN